MRTKQFKYFQLSFFFILLTIISCNSSEKKNLSETDIKKIKENTNQVDSLNSTNEDTLLIENLNIDTLDIIVVQCANGYEYSMHNFDFNPVIETELNKFDNFRVKPFPYKKLMGVPYQGVFDKKYCRPIIEKVSVDFLVLTRFDKRYDELNRTGIDWGYELRIVNTKTLEQVNSISAHSLKEYQQIEKHIKDNIEILKSDIEKLK